MRFEIGQSLRSQRPCKKQMGQKKKVDEEEVDEEKVDEEEVDEEEVDEVHALTVFSSKTQKKGLFFPADVVYNVN